MDFTIHINNNPVKVQEGELLLPVLRRFGIRIPTLCNMEGFSPTGACRLCVVEIEGRKELVTSCSFPVEKGLCVLTNTQRVMRARKSIVEMLLSNHPDDCLYCSRNANCELRALAAELHIVERRYNAPKRPFFPDFSSPSVMRDAAKCVLCSRCVRVCEELQEVTAIDFISRSNQTIINSAFKKGLNNSCCVHCGQCITVCPTGALSDLPSLDKVQAALDHKGKKVFFLVSPALVVSIAEHLDFKPHQNVLGLLTNILKKLGASKIFDLSFAIDLHIRMEAQIIAHRFQNGIKEPLISSCCPSWVKYAETFMPEIVPHLSPVKSPQQVFGTYLKGLDATQDKAIEDDAFIVSLVPCVGARFEFTRPENTHKGIAEIDAVLTTRELLNLIRLHGIDITKATPEAPDMPFDKGLACGFKMGYSGGKSEAIAEALYPLIKKKRNDQYKYIVGRSPSGIREAKLAIGLKDLKIAWASGQSKANKLLESLRSDKKQSFCYIEIMACSDGCAGGGGHPIDFGKEKSRNRKKICQEFEKECALPNGSGSTHAENFLLDMEKSGTNHAISKFRTDSGLHEQL